MSFLLFLFVCVTGGGDACPCSNLPRLQIQPLFSLAMQAYDMFVKNRNSSLFYTWTLCRVLSLSMLAITAHSSC